VAASFPDLYRETAGDVFAYVATRLSDRSAAARVTRRRRRNAALG
jgi:hypothetical protein